MSAALEFEGPVKGLKVKDVMRKEKPFVSCSSDDSVEKVLKTLSDRNFLSLPVINEQTGKFDGSVDVWDLVMFIVSKLQAKKKTPKDISSKTEDALFNEKIGAVLSISKSWRKAENPFLITNVSLEPDDSLSEAVNLFWGGHHRLPICHGNPNKPFSFFSQSDLVKFMAANMGLILGPHVVHHSLHRLGYKESSVVTCKLSDTVFHCFVRCVQENVSAVAIVNKHHKLIANLSCSDLRNIHRGNMHDLSLSVEDFLAKYSLQKAEFSFPNNVNGFVEFCTPRSCKLTDKFELVVFKIVALKVHRLWIVDDHDKPTGVVSLSDLMKTFLLGREI